MDSVWINGYNFLVKDFIKNPSEIENLSIFEKEIIAFITDWLKGREEFKLMTSGSTGYPKTISIHRNQMIASAEMTLDRLKIKKDGKALMCLNPAYVAGCMMIVRSLIGKLNLFALSPVSNPLIVKDLDYNFDLAAFVPYQVIDILNHNQSLSNFRNIKNVLIGGANLPDNVIIYLRSFNNNIFQTFGMTETVSHIALKKLSGEIISDTYEVLKGIEIDKDNRGCLTVKGVITGGEKLITNDLVELIDKKRFLWKGRIDQVINTGGVKINIIDLEKKIEEIFKSKDISLNYFIASLPDYKLGERVILVVEAVEKEFDLEKIKNLCTKRLSKFERPREIHVVRKFLFTESGKVNRPAILNQIRAK